MSALDDVLASITLSNLDSIAATVLARVTEVRQAAVSDDTARRASVGTRAASLRSSAAAATTDQATASAAAATETAVAAAVAASTPALTLDHLAAVRDQLAAIHATLAELQTWRAQTGSSYALATTATADLATVVATKL